jgi:arsenite methyltransferase
MDQTSASLKAQPDYGIDAPGLVRFFFAGGCAALLSASLAVWLLPSYPAWRAGVGLTLAAAAFYLLGMGCLMLFWSKVTKVKGRDTILDQIEWRGDERVLDVGCGRGLMLVGAAKRLTTGKAVGVDIWQAVDQSGNTPEAALANARKEGVGDRIEVATGDARSLPFPDQSFDIVVSHWVIHNLPSEAERDRALEEMQRVLRLGGQLILADIENRDQYSARLAALGLLNVRLMFHPVKDMILRTVSFGSFGPATHYAQKPESRSQRR